MIRSALLYLGVGFSLGALLLANKGIPFAPSIWRLLAVHVEFLLVGWTMQLAIGVAYWILPRHSAKWRRGHPTPAWVAYILFNAGILIVALGGWVAGSGFQIVAGRGLEMAGLLLFAAQFWSRVKPSRV